jgi:hypothetical protein
MWMAPRDVRLQTRDARRQLAPQKEPYWKELRRGLHVGYYKAARRVRGGCASTVPVSVRNDG